MAENLTTELGHIIPDVYFDKVNLHSEGEKLIVKINAHLKDFVESDVISSWLADEDFASCFRVKMYYSLNPAVTDYAIENTLFRDDGAIPNEGTFKNKEGLVDSQGLVEGFGKSKDVKFVKSDYISVSDSGNEIIEIPLKQQTIELDETPAHLTVFFHPRVDLKTLVGSIGLGGQKLTSDFVNSKKIFAFTIFDNGQIVSTQKQFITEDDVDKSGDLATVWSGPVHYYRPDTGRRGFMKGPRMLQKFDSDQNYWLDVPHDWLEPIDVPYNIIQDFRSVARFEQTQLDLTQIENQLMTTFKIVEKFTKTAEGNKIIDKKPRYFSQLFVSRNDENQASFVFMFDQMQFLKDNSRYPGLLKSAEIYPWLAPRISSIQIYRTRVDEKAPDDDNGPILIAQSGQGHNAAQVQSVTVNGNKFLELVDLAFVPKGLRAFAVLDDEIKDINAGEYSYRIALEVTDPTIPYIKDRLANLKIARSKFSAYYEKSLWYSKKPKTIEDPVTGLSVRRTYPYYDYITEKFIPEFQNSVTPADWGAPLSDLRSVLGDIYGPAGYVLGIDKKQDNMNIDYFQNLVQPTTGSPDGIKAVLEIMDKFITTLEKLVSVHRASAPADKPAISKTKVPKTLRAEYVFGDRESLKEKATPSKYKKKSDSVFAETFDVDQTTGVGCSYMSLLGISENPSSGVYKSSILKEYSYGWVDARFNLETDKYFGEGAGLAAKPWEWGKALNNSKYKDIPDNINNQKYSYLTPSRIDTLALGSTNQLFKDGIIDVLKYQKLLLDIMQYKKTGSGATFDFVPNLGAASLGEHKVWHGLRSALIDVLGEENCIMVSEVQLLDKISFAGDKKNVYNKKGDKIPSEKSIKKEEAVPPTVPLDQEDYNPNLLFIALAIEKILEQATSKKFDSIKNLYYEPGEKNEDFFTYDFNDWIAAATPYYNKMLESMTPPAAMQAAKRAVFTSLPNQLKALILSPKDIYSKYTPVIDPKDPMKDPDSFMAIWMNFKNLMKVEYFTGFKINEAANTQLLADSNWKLLSSDYKKLPTGDLLLCRLRKHVDQAFGIVENPLLDLPTYDQYFFINIKIAGPIYQPKLKVVPAPAPIKPPTIGGLAGSDPIAPGGTGAVSTKLPSALGQAAEIMKQANIEGAEKMAMAGASAMEKSMAGADAGMAGAGGPPVGGTGFAGKPGGPGGFAGQPGGGSFAGQPGGGSFAGQPGGGGQPVAVVVKPAAGAKAKAADKTKGLAKGADLDLGSFGGGGMGGGGGYG